MKALLLITLVGLTISNATRASTVLYCGGYNSEGAYLKVEPAKGRLCMSAGSWGSDYCDRTNAATYSIVHTASGTLVNPNASGFSEYIGQSPSGLQFVRFFQEAAAPSGGSVTIHLADLFGNSSNMMTPPSPNSPLADGQPVCLRGDDSDF